jgi:hypothetical protein
LSQAGKLCNGLRCICVRIIEFENRTRNVECRRKKIPHSLSQPVWEVERVPFGLKMTFLKVKPYHLNVKPIENLNYTKIDFLSTAKFESIFSHLISSPFPCPISTFSFEKAD